MATSSNLTLYSIDHAAPQLGVSHQTLRNLIAAGDVKPTALLNGKQPVFSGADIRRLKKSTSSNGRQD